MLIMVKMRAGLLPVPARPDRPVLHPCEGAM
jgi:hypothetical protein